MEKELSFECSSNSNCDGSEISGCLTAVLNQANDSSSRHCNAWDGIKV